MTQLVVTDTSCLIDLHQGGLLSATLLLPFQFVVALPLIAAELHGFTEGDWEDLKARGLEIVNLSPQQVKRAFELNSMHAALSPYDCFSLALAESNPGSILLTGDLKLRRRAISLSMEAHGILWVADQIERAGTIPESELLDALESWAVDPLVFLPKKQLIAVIERLRKALSA